jgi:murein DD-endopeptidase MepM/ murein hydrolase activator NlpD
MDSVDITYRFGSTQGSKRDPHHGVEFLNGAGTPVLAAADGKVLVAGSDRLELFAPYPNFYGNLVVLEHTSPFSATLPIYTLYAHLSEIMVSQGQAVKAGQEIGKVGMTGAATGSHLHFEVRLGENSYNAARNPELWLKPHLDDDGNPMGALAGRIFNSGGKPIKVGNIVLQHLPDGPDGQSDWEIYLGTYEDPRLPGQLPWQENFAAGDLPAGWYRISFPHYGVQQRVIQVFPGQVSVITFNLED